MSYYMQDTLAIIVSINVIKFVVPDSWLGLEALRRRGRRKTGI